MSLSIENSIARILDQNGDAIGTGFLVAPGYVLTCAHVVLQAIGTSGDFSTHKDKPTEQIILTFPETAPTQEVRTEVVSWQPYNLEYGDIAGLRVLETISEEIQPISIYSTPDGDLRSGDIYWAYSFADPGGNRSDPYIYKSRSTGKRILFRKKDREDDETIRGGFSGAPMWNETQKRVIGMLTTAHEEQGKAFAIPKVKLDPVLHEITAYRLSDILQDHLNHLNGEDKRKLTWAIEQVFQVCGSGEDWGKGDTLEARLWQLSQLGDRGWNGTYRVMQFAVFLATMSGNITPDLYQDLKAFVELGESNFQNLLDRALEEKAAHNIPSGDEFEHLHLLVEIKPEEQVNNIDEEVVKDQKVCVSIWADKDRKTSQPQFLVENQTKIMRELPGFIEETLAQIGANDCTIHLFVPLNWLDFNFDTWQLDEADEEDDLVFGGEYKLLARANLELCPIAPRFYTHWQQKWQLLKPEMNHLASDILICLSCQDKVNKTHLAALLESHENVRLGDLFRKITKNGRGALPLILWLRRQGLQAHSGHVLSCRLIELPERIRQERETAMGQDAQNTFGRHLTLVWENPDLIPPTWNTPLKSS